MYRTYVKASLQHHELKARNKYAPEGVRYCNGMCQDYRDCDDFSVPESGTVCIVCTNTINLGKRQIKDEIITLEEFKADPQMVYGKSAVVETTQLCVTCKEFKSSLDFEGTRKTCKACKAVVVKTKNSDIKDQVTSITNLREDLTRLEAYVKQIPKDKLVQIISHFSIGRKSTDTKEKMIFNIVTHFRALQNPLLCQSGCGIRMKIAFTTCLKCKPKRAKKAVDIMVKFEENIDEILTNLEHIEPSDYYKYNKKQVILMYTKLNIKPAVGRQQKEELIDGINKLLKDKAVERQKQKKEKDKLIELIPVQRTIEFNGITVTTREDGYINATEMCKAGNRIFANWRRLDSTNELINVLASNIGCSEDKIMEVKTGRHGGGSWIHPDIAMQLAQWISPTFALIVSRWIRELAVTGYLSLGHENTSEQIIALQNELHLTNCTVAALTSQKNKLLRRRDHHKFKTGPCFYIISDGDSASLKYKPGEEGVNINVRLAQHRSTTPEIRLEFLVYTEKCKLLESSILERYIEKRTRHLNHEWIFDINVEHIIESTMTLLHFLGLNFTVEQDLESYNKEITVDNSIDK